MKKRSVFLISLISLFMLIYGLWDAKSVSANSNSDCLECHGDKDIEAETERGKKLNLFVDVKKLDSSIHKGFKCTQCHAGAQNWEEAPHNGGKALKFRCKECHTDVDKEYEKSIHGISSRHGDTLAANCNDCHGGHYILPSDNKNSKTNSFNLHKTCAACHQKKEVIESRKIKNKEAVEHFVDSIHGRALLKDGLVVAPTCNDCHGVHDILPSHHPDSRISRHNVPKTCGKCHVKVEDIYNESIHGKLLKKHDKRGPVCTTCHTSHTITAPEGMQFKLDSDRMCGQCHMDRLENYHETFHGKALALGREGVAACYDCHGHHDILKSSNPKSHISKKNKVGTCAKCHPNANENFANYIVHADHTDKEKYPILYYVFFFMTALLIGVFAFFLLHTILWLFRTFALFKGDSKEWIEQKLKIKEDTEMYIRFKPIDRFLHVLVIFSFILAVLTGMPLKFYYTGWAKWLLGIMGGQNVAAVLHRLAAIITNFYFITHVLNVLYNFFKDCRACRDPETGKRNWAKIKDFVFGPDSLMPHIQDLKDVVAHNKWFFGKGPKPEFGRWTYWEKFDYLAVFWGVFAIGGSGLILWFPEFFTKIFPGWVINVALIVHSDEALLAAGFIFAFHFFNVHFRPEKFPMDPSIFSGRISKEEMLHERRRQWDKWEREGVTEQHKAKDEWESWKWIVLPGGFLAFTTGLLLVLLIFSAMFTRLFFG